VLRWLPAAGIVVLSTQGCGTGNGTRANVPPTLTVTGIATDAAGTYRLSGTVGEPLPPIAFSGADPDAGQDLTLSITLVADASSVTRLDRMGLSYSGTVTTTAVSVGGPSPVALDVAGTPLRTGLLTLRAALSDGVDTTTAAVVLEFIAPAWPPADAWDNSRGPFGGDRRTVVVDPGDADHAFTDSVDQSGVWETTDGGRHWQRAAPAGAAFANTDTQVSYVKDPADDSEWLLVRMLVDQNLGSCLFKLPLPTALAGPVVELSGWDGGCTDVTTDLHPDRPGRIVVADLAFRDPDYLARVTGGLYGVSVDAGRTWTRGDIGGTTHIPTAMAFAGDGSLLVASALSGAPADFASLIRAVGPDAVRSALAAYMMGGTIPPEYLAPYGIDATPRLLRVNLGTGTFLGEETLPAPITDIATHPSLPSVAWLGTRRGIFRADGASGVAVPIDLGADVIVPDGTTIAVVGLAVAPDPRSGTETAFVSINGSEGDRRGTYRGTLGAGGSWIFERVTSGPTIEFLDFPKASVVAAPSASLVVYAPYAEDAMLRSAAFGDPGTFAAAHGGLTGYNIFDVTEDPADPARVLATAQNVVRISTDRIATSDWGDRFISLAAPTCNVRAGVTIDPHDPQRWLAGAGGGAAFCSNSGIWLTVDAGTSWTRVLGTSGTLDNPHVVELLQHPADPDWVLAAATLYVYEGVGLGGDAGVFSSVERGALGSWQEIVDQGDAWVLLPLPDDTVLAGGDWGISRLARAGAAINVEALPGAWPGDSVRAATLVDGQVILGLASGKLVRKALADIAAGTPWAELRDLGTGISDLAAHVGRPGEVYAATDGGYARRDYSGIWRSLDGGDTWAAYSEGLTSSELCVFDLEMSRVGDRLYAGTLGGLAVRRLE
jgi:hypothetical protein